VQTTQKYTHLRPHIERPVVEQLSAAVPIVDVVNAPGLRATRRVVVGTSVPKEDPDVAER
jgi:hypothetical protein